VSATPFTRSLINQSITDAMAAFTRFGLALPPWAYWTPEEWAGKGRKCDEIRDCMLGWDVTDFGSGDFHNIGRTLFTVRNGTTRVPDYPKTYAQKYLFDPENQRAPAHFHRSKREDICCLAGGNILIQLHVAGPDDQPAFDPLAVQVDGITRAIAAGEIIRLHPGQSVCIPPRTVHQFWGEEGTGLTISSEVSSVCNDWNDNAFLVDYGVRFPTIIEDEPRTHYLCHEYPNRLQ
jgi:D-lyxose ketol-isomerase